MNQRNYEEAYIDQHDVLILGVHDRNRALNGDVVVLRLKERNDWMVRDSLYQAWRSGTLNILYDDNGQLISVPPIKFPNQHVIDEKLPGEIFQVNILFLMSSL